MFTPWNQNEECLNLYHAAMGAHGNTYCSTSDENLSKLILKTIKY